MPIMYYGSKISENMTKTPEGYLICRNVPIGRIGSMDYLAEELGLEEQRGNVIKVIRTPEELFSKATIASFEGKPVTNNHPPKNLDVNTVGFVSKGHTENVRREGDLLVADLYITDPILIEEVNGGKREVSCGYDCLWVPLKSDKFEQKNIVGNHVAVVQSGRAGPRVAIKDSAQQIDERRKMMSKKQPITKSFLAALGFKAFAQDADPEDLAKAMDAMAEEDEVKDDDSLEKEAADTKQVMDAISELGVVIKDFSTRLSALEAQDSSTIKKSAADVEFDKLEKEVSDSDIEEEAKDEASEVVEGQDDDEEAKGASDSSTVLAKLVQDMKPIIMAIPDEKTRNEAAKAFAKTVRDAKAAATTGVNGYGNIIKAVSINKKNAMDQKAAQTVDRAQAAVNSWNAHNAHAQGGKK